MEYPVDVPLTSCPCCGGKFVRVSKNKHFKHCNMKIKDDIMAVLDAIRYMNLLLLIFRDCEPNDRVNDRLDEIGLFYQDLKNDQVLMKNVRSAVQHYKKPTCFLGIINQLLSCIDLNKTKFKVKTITYNDVISGLNEDLNAAVKGTAKTGLNAKFPPADYILH